jgi:hypothetical protein
MTMERDPKSVALANYEEAANVLALVFADSPPEVRDIAIKARGDVREALGEGRT